MKSEVSGICLAPSLLCQFNVLYVQQLDKDLELGWEDPLAVGAVGRGDRAPHRHHHGRDMVEVRVQPVLLEALMALVPSKAPSAPTATHAATL